MDTFIEKDLALAHISSANLGNGRKAAQPLASAIGEEGKVPRISVKTGRSIVTRDNLDDPSISKYLYKAECQSRRPAP